MTLYLNEDLQQFAPKNRYVNGRCEPHEVATSFANDDSMRDYITKTLFFARRPDEQCSNEIAQLSIEEAEDGSRCSLRVADRCPFTLSTPVPCSDNFYMYGFFADSLAISPLEQREVCERNDHVEREQHPKYEG